MGCGADFLGLRAGDAKKRADERDTPAEGKARRDAGEAACGGAANKPHQERFELVVGVVGGGDKGTAVAPGERGEGAVAGDAGVGFEIAGSGANADSGFGEGKAEGAGEFGRGVAVGACLAGRAHVVKDVGDDEVVGGGGEGQNEAGGVGATRTGDEGSPGVVADRATAGEFPPGGDGAGDARGSPRRGPDERALLHGPMIRCILRPQTGSGFVQEQRPSEGGALDQAGPTGEAAARTVQQPEHASGRSPMTLADNPWTPWIMAFVMLFGLVLIVQSMRRKAMRNDSGSEFERLEALRARLIAQERAESSPRLRVVPAPESDSVREADQRAAQLERLITAADERIRELRGLASRPAASPQPRLAAGGDSAHRAVYELADRGLSPLEIARELGQPTGQVELILNLRRAGG